MKSRVPGSFIPSANGMECDRSHWKLAPSKAAIGVTRPFESVTCITPT
jgi:hypothetical protein